MKKIFVITLILACIVSVTVPCYGQKSAADILRAGLLGAGAGAIGSSVSGADGDDIWKGALTGAGVTIIGGALLDAISNNNQSYQNQSWQAPQSRVYYTSGYNQQPVYQQSQKSQYELGYAEGYKAGYKAGYMDGLK
ncbi:MAG: hypothetical protein WBD00_03725 [Candidatus Omnitrophota bacterium]